MPKRERDAALSVWQADLNAMLRSGPVSAMKSYSIFSKRLVPGRASSQTWILAAATMGLLILYPLFAAQIFFAHWNVGQNEIVTNWENAQPKPVIGAQMTIPSHLAEYETRGENADRIVFGLTLAEIIENVEPGHVPDFDRDAARQKITLTFFRPNQSTFGLNRFFSMYGGYLQDDRTIEDDGLTTQHFVRGGPFDNEVLHFETGYNRSRYYVRCFESTVNDRLNTCFRNLEISEEVALRYSFDKRLLPNWVGLESVIVALANRMTRR